METSCFFIYRLLVCIYIQKKAERSAREIQSLTGVHYGNQFSSSFPLKASPGRGKLSPQVTDEGADKQQFAGKLPLIRLLTAFVATFPPRGEGFCTGSIFKS